MRPTRPDFPAAHACRLAVAVSHLLNARARDMGPALVRLAKALEEYDDELMTPMQQRDERVRAATRTAAEHPFK